MPLPVVSFLRGRLAVRVAWKIRQQVEVNQRGSLFGMEALAEFSLPDWGCLLFLLLQQAFDRCLPTPAAPHPCPEQPRDALSKT